MAKAKNEEEFTTIRVKKSIIPKIKELHGKIERTEKIKLRRYDALEMVVDWELDK